MTAEPWQGSNWVAGVDGCPDGWVVVLVDHETQQSRVIHCARFSSILELSEAPRIIAVDMPIGLPDRIDGPGRVAEQSVRPLLGARQSSVFSIPARAAVFAESFAESCAESLAASTPPRKISKQSFNIFPKIREIDAMMTPALQRRVFEVHPEVVFTLLNGGKPAPLPKKIKSRPNPEGLAWRTALLVEHGIPRAVFDVDLKALGRTAADDLVDAAACAASAIRIAKGTARRFPERVTRDKKGLDIAIWA